MSGQAPAKQPPDPEKVRAVLERLPEGQRKIAELVVEGLSVKEIAGKLNVKAGTVRKQICRIADKLRDQKIDRKKRGAEPALFSALRKIPPAEQFQFSSQQQTIIQASRTCSSLLEISKSTGIPYANVYTQAKRIRRIVEAKKKDVAFRQSIGPGQRRLPEMTAEELLKQLRQDPGRVAILFRRYACAEKGDPEFEVALLTAGADRDRLWRQRGKLQKIMAVQGKDTYMAMKLTQEQAREIRDCLEYMKKHPVLVDPVEKTVTYILTRSEAARLGLEATSEWSKKVRQEARRLAG
ncbi:MAG: response regulator transcription factor [Clostridia bacterium]|nr:response regulator transcription factor [Clostridia bacterium]